MTEAPPQAGLRDNSFATIRAGFQRDTSKVTFLPEPERADRTLTIISVDDHVVEPPDMFDGRMPQKFEDRRPRIVTLESGGQAWAYDGELLPNIGLNATAGRPVEEWTNEPATFDEMRRGTWDIHARIKEMDLDGTYASLNFPSFLAGFAGGRLQTTTKDLDLAFATTRAWNDWHLQDWAGPYPDRIIPCQLPWLHDAEVAAAEVRANAERGFTAITFPEAPDKLGFPSIHSPSWDPFLQACEETETVVCVHIGSGGSLPPSSPDAPPDVPGVLFGTYAMTYTVEYLFSQIAVRFPNIKIAISEGGIGWVPALFDRLDHSLKFQKVYGSWINIDLTPAEVLRRNFWFCNLDDYSTMPLIERIGVDHVMLEVDYPHADSSWPDTQERFGPMLAGMDADTVRKVSWENASKLYRHPVPQAIQDDPNAF
jgi:predicted TIM-barrel fold metal-dependent hydrolase